MTSTKRSVSYIYDADISDYHFGPGHPMKPHRLAVTHSLVFSYPQLHEKMKVYRANKAKANDMVKYHCEEYVNFLETVTPYNMSSFTKDREHFGVGADCPVFDGLFDFCASYTGASLQAAHLLNQESCEIAVNWSGGLHHAKRLEASGFCYINDIVLSIIELLKHFDRVLYIDIDVHHGDGVEEAFYKTDRVMTVSFHKYGDNFFPGTGDIEDTGDDAGKNYSINVPLKTGIDDTSYEAVFNKVIQSVVEVYQPGAIVLQCGADSLADDRLGCFNLSVSGHAKCVEFVRQLNIPLLILGGGGYTVRNVARCWAVETGVCVGEELVGRIPEGPYHEYFGPDYGLHPSNSSPRENGNTREYLENVVKNVLELLKNAAHAPSVQMQDVPSDVFCEGDDEVIDPDVRNSDVEKEKIVAHEAEFYDGSS